MPRRRKNMTLIGFGIPAKANNSLEKNKSGTHNSKVNKILTTKTTGRKPSTTVFACRRKDSNKTVGYSDKI